MTSDDPVAIPTLLPPELVKAAQQVIDANRAAGRTIALAESCTGGLISAALTEIAGSSDVLVASFVPYSNAAKQSMLGVGAELLETFGAVSVATAWAMAYGAVTRSNADFAVAVTGIAGPDGGTDKKPVGTVVFASAVQGASADEVSADRRLFTNDGRGGIRLQAALWALGLLMPPVSVDVAP